MWPLGLLFLFTTSRTSRYPNFVQSNSSLKMSNFSSINLCLFHFILCQQRAIYGYLLLNWEIHKHIPLKNGVSCSDLYRDKRTEFDVIFFIKTIRTVHHERFVIFFRLKNIDFINYYMDFSSGRNTILLFDFSTV